MDKFELDGTVKLAAYKEQVLRRENAELAMAKVKVKIVGSSVSG